MKRGRQMPYDLDFSLYKGKGNPASAPRAGVGEAGLARPLVPRLESQPQDIREDRRVHRPAELSSAVAQPVTQPKRAALVQAAPGGGQTSVRPPVRPRAEPAPASTLAPASQPIILRGSGPSSPQPIPTPQVQVRSVPTPVTRPESPRLSPRQEAPTSAPRSAAPAKSSGAGTHGQRSSGDGSGRREVR